MQSTRRVFLVRHGETEWSRTHRHTGLTDVPLTDLGRRQAETLGAIIASQDLAQVWTSPLSRARETCRLAGHSSATVHDDLVEWDYGEYEGTVTDEIREVEPDWSIWTAEIRHGETLAEVSARADGVVGRLADAAGSIAVFAHGQFLRILAARWVGAPASLGRHLVMGAATVSMLGLDRGDRVIEHWNTAHHLPDGPR